MTVYYIGHPTGLIKIGYARNAAVRLGGLERQYRTPMIIVATESGMLRVERARHRQFGADRLNRHQEWFRPSPELRRHMQALLPEGDELGDWPSPDGTIRYVDRRTFQVATTATAPGPHAGRVVHATRHTTEENDMTNDPMDTHVDREAFWAAYNQLQAYGVGLAQVRGDVANRVAVALLDRRAQHGLGHMLTLAQGVAARRPVVTELRGDLPEEVSSVTDAALDAAVMVAARSLAGVKR